jgi:hypothetical protein
VTQRDRVLAQLKRTGRVSPVDFLLPDVCDGLKPILRVAPRVMELRDDGYSIETSTAPNGTAIYELVQTELFAEVAA